MDLFEDRFGEFNRALLEEQIRQHDLLHQNDGFDRDFALRHIKIEPSIDSKVAKVIQALFPALIEFAHRNGLKLRNPRHRIHLWNVAAYEVAFERKIPRKLPLPASSMKYNNLTSLYTVHIILPPQLKTNEEIINLARTVFAKFIGEIYFNETFLPQEFYRLQDVPAQQELSVAFPDLLRLVLTNDFNSQILPKLLKQLAKSTKQNFVKHERQLKDLALRQWAEQWEKRTLPDETMEQLNQCYQEYLAALNQDHSFQFRTMWEKVEALNARLNFILPHEAKAYQQVEESNFGHVFQSANTLIEQVLSRIGFVQEVYERFEKDELDVDLDALFVQITDLMLALKKSGKTKIFLAENVDKAKIPPREEADFVLRLVRLLPKGLAVQEWNKEVKRMKKAYARSIHQKLFMVLISLKHWLEAIDAGTGHQFVKSEEFRTLRGWVRNLALNAEELKSLQVTIGFMLDWKELQTTEERQKRFPVNELKKAWSYFISSILIYLYYQEVNQQQATRLKVNTEKYLKAIEQFILNQLTGHNLFGRLVLFMLLIHQVKGNDIISFLLYMFQQPQLALRYSVMKLQQTSPPETVQEQTDLKRFWLQELMKLRDLCVKVYDERLANDILKGRDY